MSGKIWSPIIAAASLLVLASLVHATTPEECIIFGKALYSAWWRDPKGAAFREIDRQLKIIHEDAPKVASMFDSLFKKANSLSVEDRTIVKGVVNGVLTDEDAVRRTKEILDSFDSVIAPSNSISPCGLGDKPMVAGNSEREIREFVRKFGRALSYFGEYKYCHGSQINDYLPWKQVEFVQIRPKTTGRSIASEEIARLFGACIGREGVRTCYSLTTEELFSGRIKEVTVKDLLSKSPPKGHGTSYVAQLNELDPARAESWWSYLKRHLPHDCPAGEVDPLVAPSEYR